MARKYSKGTRIIIKEDVSEDGDYGPHSGKHGKVADASGYGNTIKKIKLDDGTTFKYVGPSVVQLEDEYEENHPDSKEDIEEKIEEYESKIEDLQSRIEDLNSRLDFMDEYDLDEYDDRYHKADQMLKEMDSDKGHSDKVKAIANLL